LLRAISYAGKSGIEGRTCAGYVHKKPHSGIEPQCGSLT
jgi:hypothetical protein